MAEPHESPLWLSHHPPSQYDRCLRIGALRLCRRCLVLYPLAFVVMALSLVGLSWPPRADPWLLMLLPLPAAAELVAEQLAGLPHRPLRQSVLTLLAALALGRGFARYLLDPGDALFWTMAAVYGLPTAAVVLWARYRELRGHG